MSKLISTMIAGIAFLALILPVQATEFGVQEYTRHYTEAEREHEGKDRRWISEGNGCFRMLVDGERGTPVECFDSHGNHLKSGRWEFKGEYGNGRFPAGVLTLGQTWQHETEIHNSRGTWMEQRERRCEVTEVGEKVFDGVPYPTAKVTCRYRRKIGNGIVYNEHLEVLNRAGAPRLTLSHYREGGSSRSSWKLTGFNLE